MLLNINAVHCQQKEMGDNSESMTHTLCIFTRAHRLTKGQYA